MDQFDPNRSFLNWAFGIAFNEVRNHIRIKSRDKLHFDRELVELLAREAEQESDISLARRQALGRCIDQLSDVHRALIRQCYLNSKSISEVAESGGLSRGALYKKLARIKQKLAQCVQQQLSTEGGLP